MQYDVVYHVVDCYHHVVMDLVMSKKEVIADLVDEIKMAMGDLLP